MVPLLTRYHKNYVLTDQFLCLSFIIKSRLQIFASLRLQVFPVQSTDIQKFRYTRETQYYLFGEEKLGELSISKISPQKSQTCAKPAKSDLLNLVGCDQTLLLLFDTFLYIFANNRRNRIGKSQSYTAAEVVPITFSYFRRQFRNVSIRLRWLARWCAGRYP